MVNQENSKAKMKGATQRILIAFIITLAVVVLAGMVYIYIRTPKTSQLSESQYFDEDKVYEKSEKVIELFEGREYDVIREKYCNEELAAKMTDEALSEAMAGLGDDWGARVEIESAQGYEAKQSGKYYAMTQYDVAYENTKLEYTIMFDIDMKLAGISIEPQ